MKKIRCFLAAIALAATLGGLSLQGIGLTANAAVSRYASSTSVVRQLTGQYASLFKGPCPAPGGDC